MTYAIDLLPEYIRNVVLSDEYMDFMGETAQEYNFSETQCDELNRLALYILVKEIDIHNLINIVKQEFNLNDDQSKALAMKLILNIVLPFPDHFGDESEYYKQLGGDVDDLYASKVLDVLMNNTSQALDEIMAPYHNLDINKEAEDMKLMFANDLVEVFYAPEEYMVKFMRGLNNTLFYILSKVENLHQQLVYALYENKDSLILFGNDAIGKSSIIKTIYENLNLTKQRQILPVWFSAFDFIKAVECDFLGLTIRQICGTIWTECIKKSYSILLENDLAGSKTELFQSPEENALVRIFRLVSNEKFTGEACKNLRGEQEKIVS